MRVIDLIRRQYAATESEYLLHNFILAEIAKAALKAT